MCRELRTFEAWIADSGYTRALGDSSTHMSAWMYPHNTALGMGKKSHGDYIQPTVCFREMANTVLEHSNRYYSNWLLMSISTQCVGIGNRESKAITHLHTLSLSHTHTCCKYESR
jgi:hypothetical protein